MPKEKTKKDPRLSWKPPLLTKKYVNFLDQLKDIADESFGKGSVEGYLAAVLIYSQLSEEMLRILIEDNTVFIKFRIYPATIKEKKIKKATLGTLINIYSEETIDIEGKDLFIDKCKNLNETRIKLVHKLTKKTSLNDIKNKSENLRNIFYEIFHLWYEIDDKFRQYYHDLKKEIVD